jgi:hypothetical protein
LIPADSLPTRVRIALRPRALQWIVKAVGMVEEFRSGFALDAHHSSVGMNRIRVETNHPAVLDGCDGGAVGRTEGTVASNGVGSCSEISHYQS